MNPYIVLLRAVNVGGTGRLPMAELRALCAAAGCADVRTHIASGNVLLRSALSAAQVRATLEAALARHMGGPVGVFVRTPSELAAVLERNPFPEAAPSRAMVVFLDAPPAADALDAVSGLDGERIALGERELYVDYGAGIRHSKLKIPAAKAGTARNLNTVAKLVELARA